MYQIRRERERVEKERDQQLGREMADEIYDRNDRNMDAVASEVTAARLSDGSMAPTAGQAVETLDEGEGDAGGRHPEADQESQPPPAADEE